MSNLLHPASHILFWGTVSFLFIRFQAFFADATDFKLIDVNFLLINLALFYLHAYWLIPTYAERKKYRQYALLTLAVTFGVSLLGAWVDAWSGTQTILQQNRNEAVNLNGLLVGFWLKLLVVLPVSFAYKFMRDYLLHKRVNRFTEPSVHALVWLLVMLPTITNWLTFPFNRQLLLFTGFHLTPLALFYVHALWLIPAYLARRKLVHYGVSLILLVIVVNAVKAACIATSFYTINIDFSWQESFQHYFWRDIFSGATLLAIVLSGAYKLTKDWFAGESVRQQLIGEKLTAELAFLKYQVNPHFLFNTLNNLYAMALTENSPRTADSVAKLGTLMRYMLHESAAPQVLLSKEIAYLQEYVALQQLRLSNAHQIRIDFRVEGEPAGLQIAPLLLVPFVENAFTHGISLRNPSFVDVLLQVWDSQLRLTVQNSVHPDKPERHEPGLGLENVKRRLSLLYPATHSLSVEEKLGVFLVRLVLVLK